MTPLDTTTPAGRIAAKFGGVGRMATALAVVTERPFHPSTIYRWTYPKEKGGTGGYIPHQRIWEVKRAARMFGVSLVDADFVWPED